MRNTMGIILTGGQKTGLKELVQIRTSSALPVGGKYRAIDFVLSNMVNSGITNVGVITQYSFRSLMDHLGSGKEWDLDRRYNGLFIFPPYLSDSSSGWYRGTADALYNNLTFLKRSNEEYVLIAPGNCVYKMIFDDLLQYHIQHRADITVTYRDMSDFPREELSLFGIMELDGSGRITDFQEKPLNPSTANGSMGIYILRRELLISLLEECAAHGDYDFVKDVLIKKLGCLNIFGYRFGGYWRNMSTIPVYYRCNIEMLDPRIRNELFMENGKVYTKVKDEAPAKYNREAEVKNSIIADGCIIEGCVENSVLFRGVTVAKGAVIRNSIVMQDSRIGENACMEYAIVDKNVVIREGKHLRGEASWPMIVGKNAVV
ncbi:MAG: glucose-1-phosphate adenylyltransferase subunit GlgD [Clostridiales bacterium]|jgi:glucose-1-phosphate adenylyltransferase|nr:glucose-1-phosphate adenylyltransferase subunit GlgD [Eubacteriales bacterium]MDH7565887.1 glucose-1-phosphate adenylyltransferase subunit GlgD [Clostridiales bacterium]